MVIADKVLSEAAVARLIEEGYGVLATMLQMLKVVPTKEQWKILRSLRRIMLICGGVRGGKSFVLSMILMSRMDWRKEQLFWLVGQNYPLTKPEFNYLVDMTSRVGLLKKASKRVDPGYIELKNGTLIETKSADDPKSLVGHAVDGVLGCEASQIDLDSYYRMIERVAEKRGWVALGGTMERSLGWYPKFFQAWRNGTGDSQSFSLPSWTNLHIFPEGREDPEILRMEREMPPDLFSEHVAGEPVAPSGLVFPEFRPDIHIKPVQYNPDLPVYMWVDPGYSDACAYEFFQYVNGQMRGFHEIYERGKIALDVIDICRRLPFWKRTTDTSGPGLIATEDIYGDQHHHMSSVAEVWLKETGIVLRSSKVRGINDVNDRIKYTLKFDPLTEEPGVVFDPSMKGILSNFGAYPDPFDGQTRVYRWKQDRDGQVYGNVPEDKHNHGIKALGYGLVDRFGYVRSMGNSSIKIVQH